MKLLRLLKTLDDLAEVLLFDVLLATKRRRRVCGALAAGALLALYLVSGYLVAPPPADVPFARIPAEMPGGLSIAEQDLISRAVGEGRIDRIAAARLRPLLMRESRELDRISVHTDPAILAQWCRIVSARRAADVGMLLIARGLLLRQDFQHMAAQNAWLAALRLGAAMTVPQDREDDVAAHVLGGLLQVRATRLLREEQLGGHLARIMGDDVLRDLAVRPSLIATSAGVVRRYQARVHRILDTWVRTNALPGGHASLRAVLPWRESARRSIAPAIAAGIDARYDEQASALMRGVLPPPRDARAGLANRALALISDDDAARVAGDFLFVGSFPGLADYGRFCVKREAEIAALAPMIRKP